MTDSHVSRPRSPLASDAETAEFVPPSWFNTMFLLVVSVAGCLSTIEIKSYAAIVVIGVALFAAPFLTRSPALGTQIVARAIWLQAAVLGAILVINSKEEGIAILLGAVSALFIAGTRGLKNRSDSFGPVAYRRTLMASLALGLADFEALAIYTVAVVESVLINAKYAASIPQVLLLFGATVVMGVALRGLFRLKMWGLVLCVTANVVIAMIALAGGFAIKHWLQLGLAFTAFIQILIPIPLAIKLYRNSQSPD